MSDAPSVQLASEDANATPGALLKRERERAALTVQQAAEDLHLDPWIIEAIEADRFQALGAPVYARGHLRKYASRLGLPVEDIVSRYEALQDRPRETDPIPAAVAAPIRSPRRSLKGPAWLVFTILAIGVAGYFAFQYFLSYQETSSSRELTPPASSVGIEAPLSTSPATARPESEATPAMEDTVSASQTEGAPSEPETAEAEGVPSAAEPTANAVGQAAPVRVRLEFTGESWTEVYDATGARLLFGTGTPQRAHTVVGVPPIQVTLGAASAVRLQVNGESVVIPRRDGRESARFTIDSDGNLR
jgi:cytoskeleton protein RodZ